jgi:hypothetical protein
MHSPLIRLKTMKKSLGPLFGLLLFAIIRKIAAYPRGILSSLGLVNNIYKSEVPNVKNATTTFLAFLCF